MIYVHDRGQMCNNILQYGHIYAWCREHGRSCMSMRFAYKYRYFRICHTRHHHFLAYLFAKYAARLGWMPTLDFDVEKPATEAAMDALMRRHATMLVDGWQVHFHDLFEKYQEEITSLFSFDDAIEARVRQALSAAEDGLDGVQRLGVHVRRGDYATFLGGRYCYDDAVLIRHIRQFAALHPGRRLAVYVCGNDPRLDEQAYRAALPGVRLTFPKGNPGEDLCLLAHCSHLLGAPSTFSLVAALLGGARLLWIRHPEAAVTDDAFRRFGQWFRLIDEVFVPLKDNNTRTP